LPEAVDAPFPAVRQPLEVADALKRQMLCDNRKWWSARSAPASRCRWSPRTTSSSACWGVFGDEPRAFSLAEQELLENQVWLARLLLSLGRQVAAHRGDGELLVAQGRTLEAVAAGLPAESVLNELASPTAGLAEEADTDQAARLQATEDRLTAVATKADGWRQALLRSARQDPLTGLADRSHLLDIGPAAPAVGGAVLFVDVDRLKEVNDRGGHTVGHQLLVRLATGCAGTWRGSFGEPWSAGWVRTSSRRSCRQ
jgi:hypothetical protein